MPVSETWDGVPENPEKSGWHWLEDGDGLRPLLWRGDDWPDAIDRRAWKDGFALLSPSDLRRATYHGPTEMPESAATHFRLSLLFGLV